MQIEYFSLEFCRFSNLLPAVSGASKSHINHDTAKRTASKDGKEEIVREPSTLFVCCDHILLAECS